MTFNFNVISGIDESNAPREIAVDTEGRLVSSESQAIASLEMDSLTLTLADTEYSINLTDVTKYSFKILSGGTVRFANEVNKVASSTLPYYTLESSVEETQEIKGKYSGTLYFASSTAGTIIIFQFWS